jgi:hypothetical protein
MASTLESQTHNPKWMQTQLWRVLAESTEETHPARRLLQSNMSQIELVLQKGGTSPKDFTLHDSDHGFRVAELMAEIIPADVLPQLSAYELAFLLLAAYLHDIGMSPEWGLLAAHLDYLTTGNSAVLSPEMLRQFQTWLAIREGIDFRPPLQNIWKVFELLTYYARDRHNDWSAGWIREHFAKSQEPLYPSWQEDLILICKSHHWDYKQLTGKQFDPRDLNKKDVLHRRYLAAALRIADILENDPERVPDVLLRHRSIARQSFIHWERPLYMTLNVKDAREVHIAAYPNTALLHRSIEETVDAIDMELALCDQLKRQHPFEIHPARRLPHRWDLEPQVRRNINEGGSYEYIEGAFRPNTSKLLELLSGLQLYGDQLAAVREMTMNAFDAVEEQIARVQLEHGEHTEEYRQKLAETHWVRLQYVVEGGAARLECKDNGVGMSKQIIERYLLVSGETMSSQLAELQLRCREAGIPLNRSGEFGLGVLSYFMLSEHVVFRTLRSQDAGGSTSQGWEFETWGVGSFGELRPKDDLPRGTEVVLHLRPELIAQGSFFSKLKTYLSDLLRHIPCRFQLTTNEPGAESLDLMPGWTMTPEGRDAAIKRELAKNDDNTDPNILASTEREEYERKLAITARRAEEIIQTLRWSPAAEGRLPRDLGHYRIQMPYFDLPEGSSLAFPCRRKARDEFAGWMFRDEEIWTASDRSWISWRGWKMHLRDPNLSEFHNTVNQMFDTLPDKVILPNRCLTELDLRSREIGTVQVHRNSLLLNEQTLNEIAETLRLAAMELFRNFLETNSDSLWHWLNCRLLDTHITGSREPMWLTEASTGALQWSALKFPLYSIVDNQSDIGDGEGGYWRERRANPVLRPRPRLDWNFESQSPTALSLHQSSRRKQLCLVWKTADFTPHTAAQCGPLVAFPPSWEELFCLAWEQESFESRGYFTPRYAFNQSHPISRLLADVPKDLFQPAREKPSHGGSKLADVFPLPDRTRPDPQSAAAWLLHCCLMEEEFHIRLWALLRERDPHFLPQIWTLLLGPGAHSRRVKFAKYIRSDSSVRTMTPDKVEVQSDFSDFEDALGDPGKDWVVIERK